MSGHNFSSGDADVAALKAEVSIIKKDVAEMKSDLREVRDALLKISGGNKALWGLIGLIVAAAGVIGVAWAFVSGKH